MMSWCVPSHPAAADPPCDITVNRGALVINVTWPKPTTGAPPTGYVVYYQADGDSDLNSIYVINGLTTVINANPAKLVYKITVVTLSTMLPSKPSAPVYSKT